MNKKEVKRILEVNSDITVIGDYDYKKDVKNWRKKHGNVICLEKSELPKWMR